MTTTTGPDAPVIPFPASPEDRLRLAVRRLESALAAQAETTAGLRGAVGDLSQAVGGLRHGFEKYLGALDRVAAFTAEARAASRELARHAERMHRTR
jgi:hypothetical protein